MCDAERLLARYDRLNAWVQLERARTKKPGTRPGQTYLRRARICTEIPRLDFLELLRELREFGETES